MGLYGDAWLREAREKIRLSPGQPLEAQYCTPTELDQLAEAVEKAIKAALIENHGSIPTKYDHKNLVTICQSTGVWDVLPPALQTLVQEVESYRSAAGIEEQNSVNATSTPQALQRYFSVARRLIDYMEYHVIGNDSVLRRLRVA
jgi:HEPN domain-containing protein